MVEYRLTVAHLTLQHGGFILIALIFDYSDVNIALLLSLELVVIPHMPVSHG